MVPFILYVGALSEVALPLYPLYGYLCSSGACIWKTWCLCSSGACSPDDGRPGVYVAQALEQEEAPKANDGDEKIGKRQGGDVGSKAKKARQLEPKAVKGLGLKPVFSTAYIF